MRITDECIGCQSSLENGSFKADDSNGLECTSDCPVIVRLK